MNLIAHTLPEGPLPSSGPLGPCGNTEPNVAGSSESLRELGHMDFYVKCSIFLVMNSNSSKTLCEAEKVYLWATLGPRPTVWNSVLEGGV